MRKSLTAAILLRLAIPFSAQSPPLRMIDKCAQDGLYFYPMSDDLAIPVQVEREGVVIRIEHPDPKSVDALITFSSEGHTLIQKQKDFEAAQGWLTVSSKGAFAATWNINASASTTQLFRFTSGGTIVEDVDLIQNAENLFTADAKRYCHNPGLNTTAIKWLDDTHLLLSINAWASGFCYSNFTEGFGLDVASNAIQRKLTESQLLHLPYVCTWNLNPADKH